MKFKLIIALCCAFALHSCIHEPQPIPEGADGGNAIIQINTRSILNPGELDKQISSLRIMAFDRISGALKSSKLYPVSELESIITHKMIAGNFDFFFIANESSAAVTTALDNVVTKSGLNTIQIPASEFNSDNDIPMIASIPNVQVLADEEGVIVEGITYTTWTVTLTRIASRFDITLESENDLTASFVGVQFNNIPDNVSLVGDYSGTHTTERSFTLVSNPEYFESAIPSSGKVWAMKVKRVILPSNVFTPADTYERILGFVVKTNSGANPGCTFGVNEAANNFTIPHNTNFIVTADVRSPLEVNVDVVDWDKVTIDGSTGQRKLSVSAIKTNLSERSISRIFFYTDPNSVVEVEPIGYVGATGEVEFNVNDVFKNLSGAGAANMTYNPATGKGYIDVETDALATPGEYIHRINLNSNGLSREITVKTIIRADIQWSGMPFIGTFHRWNETGERLIYGSNTGSWTATVENGNNSFVVLDTNKSYDPNINTEDAGGAEYYQLSGTQTTVSGTGNIYFRVGLKSKLASATTAPRYGRIILTTGAGTSYIYVRQGEAADYVYRPQDEAPYARIDNNAISSSGVLPQRDYAVRVSPYNLTDARGNLNTPAIKTDRGFRGYQFTQFPTQAGYYFQWGNTQSWLHGNTKDMVPGWNSTVMTGLWNDATNQGKWETCPAGYKRINHGSTTNIQLEDHSVSQVNHSLFYTLSNIPEHSIITQYMLKGYYADGFFDRRLIKTPTVLVSAEPNSMVSSGAYMAYSGVLTYNPATNASLFLPSGGMINSGYGMNQGGMGVYWTSSSDGMQGWFFRPVTSEGRIHTMNNNRTTGGMVRCVEEVFRVRYDLGADATGTVPVDNNVYKMGGLAPTVSDIGGISKDGHILLGWSTGPNGTGNYYFFGDVITLKSSLTLYAVWQEL